MAADVIACSRMLPLKKMCLPSVTLSLKSADVIDHHGKKKELVQKRAFEFIVSTKKSSSHLTSYSTKGHIFQLSNDCILLYHIIKKAMLHSGRRVLQMGENIAHTKCTVVFLLSFVGKL